MLNEPVAIVFGHRDIGNNDIGFPGRKSSKRLTSGLTLLYVCSARAQDEGYEQPDVFLIIHNENLNSR